MPFDGARQANFGLAPKAELAWRRDERLILLVGGASFGSLAGFAATLWMGNVDIRILMLIAAPVLALNLYLTGQTLTEAIRGGARGCAAACVLHAVAVLVWPLTALATPLAPAAFWIAPGLALTALILFASCWRGEGRALYRMSGQGALVAALMAQQGIFVLLGD